MFKRGLTFLSILFFIGCKDTPYQEPVEISSPEQSAYSFSGTVELGTPVAGATITAHRFSGLKRGEKLAEAISARDGTFEMSFKTDHDGPLLLTASGGLYRDLATGETIAAKPSQELSSAITHIKMPEKTNINAWTTFAVARVRADRGFWDKGVAELKDIDRINVDFSHISYFLSGRSTSFINIRRQELFDAEKDAFKADDPKVTLHLAHGGLSQIAQDFSFKLAKDGIGVSVLDLVSALVEDLSDRVFDGKSAAGSTVYVGSDHRINLSSYTMRKILSEAIRLYSQRLLGLGKLTEDDKRYFEAPGRLVDYISSDAQPELFPEAEQPKPIDKEPPEMMVRFAYKHSAESQFAFLQGDVTFDVQADDDTRVKSIRLLEPSMIDMRSANRFGPIGIDQEPQAMRAAEACDKKNFLKKEIETRQLSEANLICACFEATDVFDNSKKELSCFQRDVLKSTIAFPAEHTVLSSKSFSDGVSIKARVTSGLPLVECSWHVQDRLIGVFGDEGEGVLPHGRGSIDGNTCTIEEAIDGSKFFNGSYYLVLTAKDRGERTLSEKQDGIYRAIANFQVFKEPPAVEITSPSNNDYLATSHIPIYGTIENPELIKEIVAKYKHIDSNNVVTEGDVLVSISKGKKDWSAILGSSLGTGSYEVSLSVRDTYGNEKSYPPRTVMLDHKPPAILGALDGVPQAPYLQETTNYRQRFVDDATNPRYEVWPIGEATPIAWSRTPIIHRWSTRLDDVSSAPRYSFRVSDDHRLKQVRYKFNYKCSTLEDADRVADGQEGRYDIWLVQHVASFDLSRDSEADGHLQRYCLSIWAVDQAGNASNHNVEFVWKVISPPVVLDMNSGRYRAHHHKDDITFVGTPLWKLFRDGNPIQLKKKTVIGHAILANPHRMPVSAKLDIKKPIQLALASGKYPISEKLIDIEYFAYDLARGEVGPSRSLMDNSVIINANEAILAKMVLIKDLPLAGVDSPSNEFSQKFSLEVAFSKVGDKRQVVDGLRLISREPNVKNPSNEYDVPWGEDHGIRRRSAPRYGA